MSKRLPALGGKFIQMEDEIASMGVIIGASLAGAKSMTATSGPGFSLMQENLGFAMMAEVPCVVVNVMRGGPSTGNPTGPSQSDVMQSKWGTHGDHPALVLSPGTVSEVYNYTIKAFNFAEMLRTPVVVAIDEIIGHMREKIEIPDPSAIEIIDRKKPKDWKPGMPFFPYEPDEDDLVPPMMNFGEGARYHVTGLNHDITGFPSGKPDLMETLNRRLVDKVDKNIDKVNLYEQHLTEDAEILIVAYGSTARSAKRAVIMARNEGVKAGLFRPVTLFPFPTDQIREAAKGAKRIIVPEMNLGQYRLEVERVLHRDHPIEGVHLVNGEPIPPSMIYKAVMDQ